MAGAALASTAAIVVASPVIAPTNDVALGWVPTPLGLSTAKYELTTLENVLALTPADLSATYFDGYGGWVPADNPYAPFSESDYPIVVIGISGVAYQILDNLFWDGVTEDPPATPLNYAFEINPGIATEALLQETIGAASPALALAIDAFFNAPSYFAAVLIEATAPIPIVGDATYYYFNGYYDAAVGVPSVLSYLSDLITSALPSASAVSPASTETAAAASSVAASLSATDSDTVTTTETESTSTEPLVKEKPLEKVSRTTKSSLDSPKAAAVDVEETTTGDTTPEGTDDTKPADTTPSDTTKSDGSSDGSKPAPKVKRQGKHSKDSGSSGASDSGSSGSDSK